MNKMHMFFTYAVVFKTNSSEIQRDLCFWQHSPTGIDIPGLILDKASRKSIPFRYYGLIFTKIEKTTSHW